MGLQEVSELIAKHGFATVACALLILQQVWSFVSRNRMNTLLVKQSEEQKAEFIREMQEQNMFLLKQLVGGDSNGNPGLRGIKEELQKLNARQDKLDQRLNTLPCATAVSNCTEVA